MSRRPVCPAAHAGLSGVRESDLFRLAGRCTASLVRYALGRQRQGKLTVTLLPLPDGSPCPLPR